MALLNKDTVRRANECETWLGVRKQLQAMNTTNKVKHLRGYLLYGTLPHTLATQTCCVGPTRWVQCYAYLNRLVASGKIKPVYSQDLEMGRIEVIS